MLQEQIRPDKNFTAGEDTVLLIYRDWYPHVPLNQFTYILWLDYDVPWGCSYGSTPLFEGDVYTQILTEQQFREHIQELGVDYITIGYVDQNFIEMYGTLFGQPLQNGQVFKVEGAQRIPVLSNIPFVDFISD